MAAPNGAGLSQMTSPERELADKESCLSKIRPSFGSLTADSHPDMGRLSTQGLSLHRGEGLAVRSITRLEEADKEGLSSCLSTGFSWREWAGGGKKEGEGKGTRILLGKPLGIFQQREGSPRCRAAGFHELLTANPGSHGSVYPGMGEPIDYSPAPTWHSLPGAGRGTTVWAQLPSLSSAWLLPHWLVGRCPHPHIPGDGSKPFCCHQVFRAMLSSHAASLEWLRVTRAQESSSPIPATPRPGSRSQPKGKGP